MNSTMSTIPGGAFIACRYQGNTGHGIRNNDGVWSFTSAYYRSTVTRGIERGLWVRHINPSGRWYITGGSPAEILIPRPAVG